MFCPDCGFETVEGSRFCKRCGKRLSHGSNAIHEELLSAISSSESLDASQITGVEHRIEQLLGDAMRCQSEARYQEALMICEAIIEVDSTNTSAHSMMAIVYEKMGKTALAIEQLRIVTQINPGSVADRIRLDELQSQIGINRPTNYVNALPPAQYVEKKPVNSLLLALGSAAIVFLIGGVVLNNGSSKRSDVPSGTGMVTDTSTPTTTGVNIPQSQQPITTNQPIVNNGGVIQPYIAGGSPQPQNQIVQPNPLIQQPEPQNYQPRSNGNSGGSGLASIPALPPITGLTTKRDTPTTPVVTQNDTPEAKPAVRTAPQNNAPTGIYEITVNSGASTRPKPALTGGSEADTLLRIAQDKSTKGDYKGAVESYKAAQNYGANSASISNSIAQCHRRLNNLQDARRAYQDALKKANDAISRGTNVAQATRDKENAEQGLKACGD